MDKCTLYYTLLSRKRDIDSRTVKDVFQLLSGHDIYVKNLVLFQEDVGKKQGPSAPTN